MRRGEDFRWLRVVSSQRTSPTMQRLRLAGANLQHFSAPDNLHVRLYFPTDRQLAEQPAHEITHDDSAYTMRYYTIRNIDANAGWMEIDFVLHGDGGPGCNFALAARTGDLCGVSGPCGRGLKPCRSCVVIGDDTALPAIARICEVLPPDCVGRILALSQHPVTIRTPPKVTVSWIRPTRAHGFDHSKIAEDALTAMDEPLMRGTFIWVAGEFQLVQDLQKVADRVPSDRRLLVPYWRRTPTVGQE